MTPTQDALAKEFEPDIQYLLRRFDGYGILAFISNPETQDFVIRSNIPDDMQLRIITKYLDLLQRNMESGLK